MLQFMLQGFSVLQQFPDNEQAVIATGQRFLSCNICGKQNALRIRVTHAITGENSVMAQMLLYYRKVAGCFRTCRIAAIAKK